MHTLSEKQPQATTESSRIYGVAKLWKLERVADILDMPLSTAYEHARTGLFDSFIVRVGRRVRAEPGKFQDWLESGGAALSDGGRNEAANE